MSKSDGLELPQEPPVCKKKRKRRKSPRVKVATAALPTPEEFRSWVTEQARQTGEAARAAVFQRFDRLSSDGCAVPKGEGFGFWLRLTAYVGNRWPNAEPSGLAKRLEQGLESRQRAMGDERSLADLTGMIAGIQTKPSFGLREALASEGERQGSGRDEKRRIYASDPNMHTAVDATIAALSNLKNIFQRGGALAIVNERRVLPIDTKALGFYASLVARYFVYDDEGGEHDIAPPVRLMNAVSALGIYPGIRPLESITDAPSLRRDGTMVETAGYDFDTKALYLPTTTFAIPGGTADDIARAKALIEELLHDFVFETRNDFAAAVALLFTLCGRALCDGPTPLFLQLASTPGAGKTLLVDVLGFIALGEWPSPTPISKNNEEMRKLITSKAREASPLLWLDNLPRYQPLGMPALDQALTARRWNDRVLGVSQTFSGQLRMTFVATGNNIRVRAETGRRVVPIKLKTTAPNPEQRTGFLHEDLRAWVMATRPELLVAVLVLLRAALKAGARARTSYGGFEDWNSTVRAAVQHHWDFDPLARQLEFRSRSDDDVETFECLVFSIARIGRKVTASQILELARAQKVHAERPLYEAITAACPALNGELPSPKALSNVLYEFVDRPTCEYTCLRVVEGRSRMHYWFVTPAFRDDPVPAEAVTTLCEVLIELYGDHAFDLNAAIAQTAVQDALSTCVPGRGNGRVEVLQGILRAADPTEWTCLEADVGGLWSVQRRTGGLHARIIA